MTAGERISSSMLDALVDTTTTTLPQVTITQGGTSTSVLFSAVQSRSNGPDRAIVPPAPAPHGTIIVPGPQHGWACGRGSK